MATVDERRNKPADDCHANERDEGSRETNGGAIVLLVLLALDADASGLKCFGGKALNRGNAADVVGELAIKHANLLAHLRVARSHASLESHGAPNDYGHWQKRHPRNPRRRNKEEGTNGYDGDNELNDFVCANIEEALELIDVIIENAHQLAAALVFKVTQVEALQMLVGLDAHIVLKRLGKVPPVDFKEVLGNRFSAPDYKGQRGNQPQLVDAALHARIRGEQRVCRVHHRIDCQTNKQWRRKIEHLIENGIEGREKQSLPIARGVLQDSAERRVHATLVPRRQSARSGLCQEARDLASAYQCQY